MKLIIVIPTKTAPMYAERMQACEETWLKNSPVDYKGLSDADLGLVEINQHENAHDPIRTHRTIGMVKWAYERGYDFLFRVDTDAYVWINRLLKSGFENHDYMGWCNKSTQPPYSGKEDEWCASTAHGGTGFFLSRRAMEIILTSPVERFADGKFWGDLWAGHQLWKHGILCKRDTRFLDGGRTHFSNHHGNITPNELPMDHPYISIHPINPIANFHALHAKFKDLPAETKAPKKQLWDIR